MKFLNPHHLQCNFLSETFQHFDKFAAKLKLNLPANKAVFKLARNFIILFGEIFLFLKFFCYIILFLKFFCYVFLFYISV